MSGYETVQQDAVITGLPYPGGFAVPPPVEVVVDAPAGKVAVAGWVFQEGASADPTASTISGIPVDDGASWRFRLAPVAATYFDPPGAVGPTYTAHLNVAAIDN